MCVFEPNVKEHAPLSAGASVESGVMLPLPTEEDEGKKGRCNSRRDHVSSKNVSRAVTRNCFSFKCDIESIGHPRIEWRGGP